MRKLVRHSLTGCLALVLLGGCDAESYDDPGTATQTAAPPSAQAASKTVDATASCADGSFDDRLRTAVAAGATVAIGSAAVTGEVTADPAAEPSTLVMESAIGISLKLDRVLAGPTPNASSLARGYLPGGVLDDTVTDVAPTLQSATATDGRFFGVLRPIDGGYLQLELLPLAADRVLIPDIGCWNAGDRRPGAEATITVLNAGPAPVTETDRYPSMPMAEVEQLVGW